MFESVKSYSVGEFISKGEWKYSNTVIDPYELIFAIPVKTKLTPYELRGQFVV